VWGPATRAAMRAWQRAHGVAQTGQLDDATLSALAGGEGGERGAPRGAVAAVDAGRAPWALDGLRAGAWGARARREEVPDALGAVEALLTALKEATPARRRRLAAKVARLLASEATK
jgi:peptidoglycan hydrolase-like protein with peptidoglycan-binding domain